MRKKIVNILASVFVGLTLSPFAWADEPITTNLQPIAKSTPVFDIPLALVLDGQYQGELPVQISGTQVSIYIKSLAEILKPVLNKDVMRAFEGFNESDRIFIEQIEIDGVEISYNSQLLQIDVNTQPDSLVLREISFRSNRPVKNLNYIEPADFSFFLTPSIGAAYDWQSSNNQPKGLRSISGQVDFGGRIGQENGLAVFSRYRLQTGDNGYFFRSETQAIYDHLTRSIRATVGDVFGRGESFQIIPPIAGLTFERYFDYDPGRLIRPAGRTLFDLETASTVEIIVNGVTQHVRDFDPGRYNLQDLVLAQGANNIEVRITDDTGQQETLTERNFYDFDLLKKGLSDFSFSVGVKSSRDDSRVVYSDEPVFSGFFRHGLSNVLTASANLQADKNGANFGATSLWASPLGSLKLEGSMSQHRGTGSGFAIGAGYRYNKWLGNEFNVALDLDGRYRNSGFSTIQRLTTLSPLSETVEANYDSFNFSAGGRVSRKKWSSSAFANYSKDGFNGQETFSTGFGGSYRPSPDISLSLFAEHADRPGSSEQNIVARVTWRINQNIDARARYDAQQNEADVTFRRSAPPQVGNLSYAVGISQNFDDNLTNVFGDAFYTGNRFEGSVRHTVSRDGFNDDSILQTSRINASSSLVFADGNFQLSRPVRNSFAILSPHESLKGKTINVEPTKDGVAAKSDFLGAPVAVRLSPFDTKVTYIDVEDVPLGYDLGDGGFATKPHLFSGYNVNVGTSAFYSVIASVLSSGEPVSYLGGRFENLDDQEFPPVLAFTNRNGRLAATGLKPGRYRLVLYSSPDFTKEIEILETGNTLIDLGKIEIPAQ